MTEIQNSKQGAGTGASASVICASDLFRVSDFLRRAFPGVHRAYHRYLAWRIVRKHVVHRRPKYADRRVLEQVIIPFVLSKSQPRTVLEVGREPYEAFYNEFFAGCELWTIDWDAAKAAFRAPNHIVDDAANLRSHFPEQYFDFVLMNGVFGWGLNEKGAIERAFRAVHEVIVPGGIFVLGWNDTPALVPVPLDQVQALKQFTPYFFPPLNGTRFKCSTYEHTYNFYVR